MSTKPRKSKRELKRRLALPASLVRNLEDARKNLRTYQTMGKKEVEKLVNKVIEIDFVQKVRKHDVVKKASQATTEISREFEKRAKQLGKEFGHRVHDLREYIPVPTRSEVERLTKRVEQLSRKLEDLSDKNTSASAN